jgi:hypothetical protein
VHLVNILIRQEHPGPDVPPYTSFAQKLRDGDRHKSDDRIDWTVLVDELDDHVHLQYGGLTDPSYLIGTDGVVSFYNYWTHVPTLPRAIGQLLARNGRGVIGEHRLPHMLAAVTDGWRGLRRGLPQSVIELETAMPGFASGPWLGYQLKPLLAPLALRATPWPPAVHFGLGFLTAVGVTGLLARRHRPTRDARQLRRLTSVEVISGNHSLGASSRS